MTEFLDIWLGGFSVGVGSALLIFKLVYPFQLAKQALNEAL